MKLSKYIQNLQDFLKTYGDHTVIYSRDDEGNGYQEVHYEPSLGYFGEGEYIQDEEDSSLQMNAVCIN